VLRDHGYHRPRYPPGLRYRHLALLGYDPHKYYTGRGPLECEGTGIHMEPGMIGFRCNFATISQEGIITDRRQAGIHDTQVLSEAIQKGVDLTGTASSSPSARSGHRAALALKGKDLGPASPPMTRRRKASPAEGEGKPADGGR